MQQQFLEDLRKALVPYLFYWEEWAANGNCTLSCEEIEIVNLHIKDNFIVTPLEFLDQLLHHEKVVKVREITNKLIIGEGVFKEFVVVAFLVRLLDLASNYVEGHETFLLTPIRQLKIPSAIISELIKFDIISVGHLVTLHKPDEFSRGLLYKRIVDFQISFKRLNKIQNGLQAAIS